jgi:hypothetical protein
MGVYGGPDIITDGLVLTLDAGSTKSYSGLGTTWKDLSGNGNTATLVNGTTFNSADGGSIVFDGVDDQLELANEIQSDESWTLNYWQNLNITQNMFSIPSLFTIIPQGGTSSPGVFGVGFNSFTSVNTIYIDSSDNIYVGGQYGGYDDVVGDTLIKINEDGSPNSQFNSGRGIVNGSVVDCNKIQQLSNGNLVTAGTNWGLSGIAFFNSASGTTVPALNSGNFQICTSFILDEPNNSMWVLDSWSTTYESQNVNGKIFKINLTNFSIDTNFLSSTGFKSAVGKVTVSNNEGVNGGIVLQDGNLLCVGTFREYKGVATNRIVKINSTTAALDTSFVYGTGFDSTSRSAIQMNSGTIVVVGQFTNYNGTNINRIVGLNNDGSIYTSFNVGSGFNNTVNSIIYDSVNDKLFCFGQFTTYNGTTANRIVKLNSDGSIDTSFNYGTGFNTNTNTGALDTQGRLVVLSQSTTTYQEQTIPRRICRINTNGTLDTTFNSGGFNIDRFRQDTNPRLVDNTVPFIVGGFFGINSNRQIINLADGAMTFNGFKLYTIAFNHNTNAVLGYINGVLRKTTNLTARLPLKGKTFISYENFFKFDVYNRQLSQQEILQNYNATKSRFGL